MSSIKMGELAQNIMVGVMRKPDVRPARLKRNWGNRKWLIS